MRLFSWFNSPEQVDNALICVGIIGAIIEVGVAVAAVINVHKEIGEHRKKQLEKYIEIFACGAAFFFLAEAILGWRSSVLLGENLERLKSDNLRMYSEIQPRKLTTDQRLMMINRLMAFRGKKCRMQVVFNQPDLESKVYAYELWQVLSVWGGVEIRDQFQTSSWPITGIFLATRNPPPSGSEEVRETLIEAGVIGTNAAIESSQDIEPGVLRISVWPKPLPEIILTNAPQFMPMRPTGR